MLMLWGPKVLRSCTGQQGLERSVSRPSQVEVTLLICLCPGLCRDAQEMEAIAPLLEKIMHCLEFEEFEPGTSGVGQRKLNVGQKEITQSSHLGKLRPRVRFKREALWRGLIRMWILNLTSLLVFSFSLSLDSLKVVCTLVIYHCFAHCSCNSQHSDN
jgi:hypothetical protein